MNCVFQRKHIFIQPYLYMNGSTKEARLVDSYEREVDGTNTSLE